MSTAETIRARMLDAASRTLGDACLTDRGPIKRLEDDAVLSALAASSVVRFMVEGGEFSLETLPLPPISRQFQMQLTILWRRQQASPTDRQAIAGAIDRIVAELYHLTVNDLIGIELAFKPGECI